MTECNLDEITDWYLPKDSVSTGIFFMGEKKPHELSEVDKKPLLNYAHQLVDCCEGKRGITDFRLDLEGRSYRVHVIPSINGDILAFRQIAKEPPSLDKLSMNEGIKKLLLSPRLSTGGLILFAGETGQGKTTSMIATVFRRLSLFGGFCMTVEDPVEVQLPSRIGAGYCVQVEVNPDKDNSYSELLRGALRSYPATAGSSLVIGEIRDAETAIQALKASVSGHLVFGTIHGSDVTASIRRLISMASKSDTKEAAELVAASLRMIVHQKLNKKQINATILTSFSESSPVAAKIRNGSLELLLDEVQSQNNLVRLNKIDKII